MKIIHHIDDDGLCAAAIIYNELTPFLDFAKPKETDFIPYSHMGKINIGDIQENEPVFIVDLALDDTIMNMIKVLVAKHCDIVHIDHHQTTITRMQNLTLEEKIIMEHIRKFYVIGVSGALLTWVYCCMSPTEREHIDAIKYDFSDGRTHIAINIDDPQRVREYRIPLMIRYIDDWDVWRHQIPETKYFHIAFSMEQNKHPMQKLWEGIYGSDQVIIMQYINPGAIIWKYKLLQDQLFLTKHSGVITIADNKKAIIMNKVGDSFAFGDKLKNYDCGILWYYDHNSRLYKYSVYSDESSDFDCAAYCETLGGGGHKHAAGASSDFNIFE